MDSYEERDKHIVIRSTIYVARESQKAIIIGKGGSAIKKLGMQARADIEEFTGKKIFLELFVKVDKDWRDNEQELKRFGYEAWWGGERWKVKDERWKGKGEKL